MKDDIIKTAYKLFETHPYKDISVHLICDSTPVSRTTFYNYFPNKDDMVYYMIQKDFSDNVVLLFQYHLKEKGISAFFTHIKKREKFYRRIYEYDNGHLLMKCLVNAYNLNMDSIENFSLPKKNQQEPISMEVYQHFSSWGIASVIIYWIEGNMQIPIDEISRELYIMVEHPLSYVRDNFLK